MALKLIIDSSDHSLAGAAKALASGHLVGIPTETVYGLAADASNPEAVRSVFRAKERPADHPLIVHLAVDAELDTWAVNVPEQARKLADAFWPGPLTLIVERSGSVDPAVTGGLDSVALRTPSHPVAQRLLAIFGGGIVAPSANRFGRVSPTTANDVVEELGASIELVVDGGPCEIGVESTIVAWAGGEPVIARPGAIDADALSSVLGREVASLTDGQVRAPGTLPSHYAPSTPLDLCSVGEIPQRLARHRAEGAIVGVLSLAPLDAGDAAVAWHSDGDLDLFARDLYRHLREADRLGLDVLIVAPPPATGIGAAIADRLQRAARR